MRIEAINLSNELYAEMGVGMFTLPADSRIQMKGLGQCVVIAGKNGAGKTRLLTLIEKASVKYLSGDEREAIRAQLAATKNRQSDNDAQVVRLEALEVRDAREESNLDMFRREANGARLEAERLVRRMVMSDAFVMRGPGKANIVHFVPRSTALTDPKQMVEEQAEQVASSFSGSLSAQGSENGAPAYARQTFRSAVAERGRLGASSSETNNQSAEAGLRDLLASLLGADVEFELGDDLNLRIKGLSNRYAELLSDGQKVLFQLACMLHSRQASLQDCILFMDEPENHLHPAVLNELMDRLLDLLPEGQVWVSTHSVPLIAHLVARDSGCLWFADGGKFAQAGRSPEKVLDSLLGGPDGARRVNELTLMPSRLASSTFLQQCLLAPGVAGYKEGDAQLEQIRKELIALRRPGVPLKVIDFGSGKGRLLDSIAREAKNAPLAEIADYVAYEPHPPSAEQCQRLCSELYQTAEPLPRAFTSLEHILQARGEDFADVAVVCNVLHEVHPDEWPRAFGGQSLLARLLKSDGYILFVEDYALPVGERAHEYGFLLLDEKQLEVLFAITSEDVAEGRFTRSHHPKPLYQERLIAHLVSAKCLRRMSEVTRHQAIQSLQHQSAARLKSLLASAGTPEAGSKHGRESALVTQLAANATVWLMDQNY